VPCTEQKSATTGSPTAVVAGVRRSSAWLVEVDVEVEDGNAVGPVEVGVDGVETLDDGAPEPCPAPSTTDAHPGRAPHRATTPWSAPS
jgi:hypothetical protein